MMLVQYVFISYASGDRDIADRVRVYLEDARIKVWVAHEDLAPGTPNWEQAIREAISSVDGVVLIATRKALTSQVVRGELDQAKKHKRPIYPMWAYGTDLSDAIPLDLGAHQCFDVRDENFEAGMRKLVDYFNGKVGPEKRIDPKDTEYRRRMQRAERERILHAFRDSVKGCWSDKSRRFRQKLPDILAAGSTYVAHMSEFEKRWGDDLLPAEDSLSKNLLVIVSSLERAVHKEGSPVAKGAAIIKHAAQLLTELERHWGDDKEKTIEGSVVEQMLLDEPDDEESVLIRPKAPGSGTASSA
ncbi:MAG: toll/interleukin-1 receptor domain-containing protein [Ktedonobacterales bacterium]